MSLGRFGVVLTLSLFAARAMAAEVAVFPPRVTNLTAEQAEAIGTVLAQKYALVSGKAVLSPAQARAAIKEGGLPEAAKALGVAEYLDSTAVALEKKILVAVTLNDLGGNPLFTAQMTAVSLDDMPEVSDRIARALVSRIPPEQTLTRKNVTRSEGSRQNRAFAEKVMGVRTGVTYPFAAEKLDPMLSVSFDGRLEADRYFLEFGAGFTVAADGSNSRKEYGALSAEVGGSYYLGGEFTSPYVGAGVIPRIVFGSGIDSTLSLAPYAQAGVMFMRASSTRLYVDLRIAQNVLPLRSTSYDYETYRTTSSKALYPTEVSVQVGIGW